MKRIAIRVVPALVLLVAVYAWVAPLVSGQASGMPSTRNGEWPMYTADLRGSKYSPLDQINGTNFSKLEVAWRLKTDNFGPRPETKLEGTPIMVKGMLYATAGTRRAVVALNPTTGEIKWTYSMDEGERATRWAPRQLSGRGLSYWTDGKGDERVIYVTTGYRLVSLNAKTGQPVAGFGTNGIVDLKQGIVINGKQADLEKSEIGLHSTPTVVNDTILVGSSMFEGLGYEYATNVQGQARAFDAKTGKLLWAFHGIPRRGEFGFDTWKNESAGYTGNNGVWTQITADPEAGIVYLPVETPTIDEYGGNRPGDNLFAESLVAVDLRTGVRKWHFQFVHHPLWDHDMSSAPLLIDTTIDGKPRKVVAVPSKQGWLYCFDRITGVPIWPIEERPVPQTTMKHEQTAPTQPFPTKPVPYARTYIAESDLIDFTPELRKQALANLKFFRWEPTPYVPPTGPESKGLFGAINIGNTAGGTNWPGAGFRRRDRHLLLAGRHDQRHRRSLQRGRVLEGHAREQGQPHAALGSRAELRHASPRSGAWRRPRSGRRHQLPRWRRPPQARRGPRRPADRQAALRRAGGHRPEEPGQAPLPGSPRRHARQHQEPPDAQGHEHSEDGPERQRRRAHHQDLRGGRRSRHHDGQQRARRIAARLRQDDRRAGW